MACVALGWTEDELKHLFRAYLDMLADELAGRHYVKVEYNREVQNATGRSKSSVEFKFANASAVLDELGLDWVQGYLPRYNYQALMTRVAEEVISSQFPELRELPRRTQGARGGSDLVPGADRSQTATEALAAAGATPVEWPAEQTQSDIDYGSDSLDRLARLTFADLWERACGGASAAVSMNTQESAGWPTGASAPGGDEVLEFIRAKHQIRGAVPDEIDVVLLIGGPGNGKSELLRKAKEGLQETDTSSTGVALRRYGYRYESGHQLTVVNDASIPAQGKESADGELAIDLMSAMESRSSALLAVNRGRLDDHSLRANAQTGAAEDRAREILSWVHETATGVDSAGYVRPVIYRDWASEEGVPAVRCFIVLMDACSLLEQRPEVALDDDGGDLCGAYTIASLPKRHEVQERTPGGKILAEFIERSTHWAADLPDWHPVRANIEALEVESQRAGVGTWLRAGELAGGRKVTYRELWGAYIRAVVGELPEAMTSQAAERDVLTVPQPTSYGGFRRLAHLRTHQALVGVDEGGGRPRNVNDHPVLRLTALIDPVRDADPSWARPVHEAMAFRDPDVGPLATLGEHLRELDEPLSGVTKFDQLLDDAFVEHVKELDPTDRRVEEAWYGAYLLRLYSLSSGRCAFRDELELWAREWRSTHKYWQEPLAQAIRTLLFPAHDQGANMLLPALQSRAVPLLAAAETPQFVRKVNTQHLLKKVRRGDELSIRLDLGEIAAEIDVDFALLREAMACAGGGPGVTQRAIATMPRLERFRATLLRHDSGEAYAVLDRENLEEVTSNYV